MCAARNAVGKSDIFNEPALRGTSGETGDSVNREAVFGDVSRPDVSGSEGIGDEPALSRAAAAEEERRKRLEWLETRPIHKGVVSDSAPDGGFWFCGNSMYANQGRRRFHGVGHRRACTGR